MAATELNVYYFDLSKDVKFLKAFTNSRGELFKACILYFINENLFSKFHYEQYNILTSSNMQHTYKSYFTLNRKKYEPIIKIEYLLIEEKNAPKKSINTLLEDINNYEA